MKIALAGATGILGRWLSPLLVRQGHSVLALNPSPAKAHRFFGDSVSIAQCDLLDADVESILPGLLAGCDSVAHIATALPRDLSVPGAMDRTNRLRAEGTTCLIDAARTAGVERYVQQNIVFVYPDKGDEWITEEEPLLSSSTLIINMERMVRESGLNWCILRCGRFTGKDTYQEQTVERLRAGTEVVPCNGRNFVPLVHVADVASAFALALTGGPANAVFNIVADSIRNGEYLDRLAARLGVPTPRRDPQAKCPPSHRVSSEAARSALGWSPSTSIYAFDV